LDIKTFIASLLMLKFLIMDKMVDFEWFTSNNVKKATFIELIIILMHKPPNYETFIEALIFL
jgi:hypothetical protein